jgi:hypothetical protein
MAPLTRATRKHTNGSGSSAYIRSPSSATPSRDSLPFSQRLGGSTSVNSAPGGSFFPGRRRTLIRSLSGGITIFLVLVVLLLFLGAFDPDPRIGGNIHPYTFQVMPAGDPWQRKGIEYKKPPGYWEFQADWNAPSEELLANVPPSQRKCDPDGPLLL